ncbi:Cytochrome P450 CYP82H23 [Vitis vinifera]|uniref:Cytochrome P450 CYP82H23 n=1 Tax=Vitis vinifera TaxID=29760 RepID=A0A438FEJ2_VITVI|nr:Cytochrome P450 CYP82H23 [Vitis vinifera]
MDKAFATRPRSLAGKLMGYDHAMFGFSPYGTYWRDVRKLASVELLSNRQLELLNHVRDSEVKLFHQRALQAMDTKWGQASLGRDEGEVLAHGSKCNGERSSWEMAFWHRYKRL